MAQRYEYQDIDGHVILLFVHPAYKYKEYIPLNNEFTKANQHICRFGKIVRRTW